MITEQSQQSYAYYHTDHQALQSNAAHSPVYLDASRNIEYSASRVSSTCTAKLNEPKFFLRKTYSK